MGKAFLLVLLLAAAIALSGCVGEMPESAGIGNNSVNCEFSEKIGDFELDKENIQIVEQQGAIAKNYKISYYGTEKPYASISEQVVVDITRFNSMEAAALGFNIYKLPTNACEIVSVSGQCTKKNDWILSFAWLEGKTMKTITFAFFDTSDLQPNYDSMQPFVERFKNCSI